ncbi:olfactory receptor 4K3-like [Sphaeramia orbicularis]|uniref:olfactory receptor 4K3-like n=1 Tax=Sphaeramia orbicularis TaxID=375764 RepID=UPI00117F5E61|nr:olfactory receptor 4K3-like [Sphaeramia orbicularis]
MDTEFNETYITLDGYVELHQYKHVYFLIIFIAYVLIICSNFTIVCVIWMHKHLHKPMYIFIAALLLNSVLFSTVIYPKLLTDFLSENQIISELRCRFQGFMYYSLGGSEFMLLAVMAYDRYVCICKPLQYATIMTKTNIIVSLVLAWLIPAGHLVGSLVMTMNWKLCRFTLNGIFCNNAIFSLFCVNSRAQYIFGVIILINVTFIPMLFIVFTYIKILIISFRSSKQVQMKATQTCLPHLLVLITFSCLCAFDVIIIRIEYNFPKTVKLVLILQLVLYHPLFNPIIYGLKMKEIKELLKRMFCPAKLNLCSKAGA